MAATMPDLTTPEPNAEEVLRDGSLAIDAACDFTGLSRAELYRRMDRGALAYTLQGRRRLIPRRALVRMLAGGLRTGRPDAA